jgi:hypothetical protein
MLFKVPMDISSPDSFFKILGWLAAFLLLTVLGAEMLSYSQMLLTVFKNTLEKRLPVLLELQCRSNKDSLSSAILQAATREVK